MEVSVAIWELYSLPEFMGLEKALYVIIFQKNLEYQHILLGI